jgi:nitrile hydratase beta subunit
MDGIHDLGGMQGFGVVERDEDVFHAPWERRAFALAMTASIEGNTDDFRHSIERLDPAMYLGAGYYGRWLAALEVRLAERHLVSSDEVDRRAGDGASVRPSAVASIGLPTAAATGGARRSVDRPPRFGVGDAVRVADVHPSGHTRLPRWVRNRCGVVQIVHPAFVFPDTHAHGRGEHPQYVYAVRFAARDLWGEGDHTVHVDIFEPHLEPR